MTKQRETLWVGSLKILFALLLAGVVAGCSVEARKARHLAKAEDYFKAGDYEKAKIEYMNLLLADPHDELPFRRIGFIWAEEGDPLRAVSFLMKGRELAPNDLPNRLTLARTLMSLSRIGEARKEVLAVLEQSAEDDEALVLLTDTDQTKGDLDYADQYLRKVSASGKLSVQLASANVAVQRGDFASAANSLQRAVGLDVKSPLPHLALANLHIYEKKFADAEQEFKTAAELAPLRSPARLRYAEFEIAKGAGDQVKNLLEDTVHQAPDYLPAWCVLGQIALAGKRYDESLRLLENVFSRDPQNPEARILEAQTFLAKGDAKKAVERFEQLEKTYKDIPIIDYELARAYLQNNNPGQANIALTHAIAAKSDYLDAILLRGELDLQGGNAILVVPSMTTILKQRPHLREAELLLTEAYLSLGRFEEAVNVIRDQIHDSPEDADAYYQLGLVLHEQKKLKEAKSAFETVAKLIPDNLKAINQLVELDIETKDFAAAMSRVQGELQKHPESAIAHFMEGKVYAAQGRLDLAEASLNKALELDSNSLGTHQLLIVTYLNDNKPDLAIERLQKLLSADPHQTWALSTLAATYAKTGDLEKARDTYEKLLSETPNAADVMTKLAVLYADQFNQVSKAYDLASKARTLAPVDPFVADTLGWISFKQADYQKAVELIREAADKLPDNAEVEFHLGMADYVMDQANAARAAFKKALAIKTEFPHKDDAARWLAYLEDDSGGAKQFSVAELEALLQLRPKDVVARSRLASLYDRQGAFEKAAAQYETALNINPNLANAALELAQLYSGPLHNSGKALEFAKTARDLDKNNPRTGHILGKTAYQTGDFSWAYDLLSATNHQQKGDAEISYDLAWAAYSLGKVPEALETMRHALDLGLQSPDKEDAQHFIDLVQLEESDKKSIASTAPILKLLNTHDDYVPALMVKAAILMERGNSDAAAETYNQVLRKFPDFAPAEKQLARLWSDSPASFSKAYELAIKARNSLPDDPEVAETLGQMSYSRKDYAYAVQLLQESARRKPLDARSLYYLGMSYLAIQNENESYQALTRSLSAGLREPLASEAKRVLGDLEQKRHKDS